MIDRIDLFSLTLPRMCLYCRIGWLVFPTIGDMSDPCVACTYGAYTARPRKLRGGAVPRADYMPILPPDYGIDCQHFVPVRPYDDKAGMLREIRFIEEAYS